MIKRLLILILFVPLVVLSVVILPFQVIKWVIDGKEIEPLLAKLIEWTS